MLHIKDPSTLPSLRENTGTSAPYGVLNTLKKKTRCAIEFSRIVVVNPDLSNGQLSGFCARHSSNSEASEEDKTTCLDAGGSSDCPLRTNRRA